MNISVKIKIAYLLYFLGVFFLPLGICSMGIALLEKKQNLNHNKINIKHCNFLIKWTSLNLCWTVITLVIIFLFSFVGYKTFMLFFILGLMSFALLWAYTTILYLKLSESEFSNNQLPNDYFQTIIKFYKDLLPKSLSLLTKR